jgi:hypothetical protein
MGAVIRLRSRPYNNLQNFDIGLAGPLAGFIVALIIMAYGFLTLPPPDYIFQFHEEYRQFGLDYAKYVYEPGFYKEGAYVIDISIGKNLLFLIFEQLVADPSRIPNSHEIMHYPVLLASYFALFVTCLNLLPIGQLDGGHIAYGLFGSGTHRKIALVFFVCLLFYAGLGLPFVIPSAPVEQQMVWIPVYLIFLYCFHWLGINEAKNHSLRSRTVR